MPGRISDDAIRTIRERASLIEVVSDVVALRRRGGRSAVGLCPFHAEKTPSFTVSEEHGFYHCFGCGEHGDVFAFVMKTQSLAFPDAVRDGRRALRPARAGGRRRQRRARASRWSAVNEAAAAFFRGALRGPDGTRATRLPGGARHPSRHDRALRPRLRARRWRRRWRAICAHRRSRSTTRSPPACVMRRDDGGLLDRFRDRLIFPITDLARSRDRLRRPRAPGHADHGRSAAEVPELARVADLPQGPQPLRARRWRATPSGSAAASSSSRAISTSSRSRRPASARSSRRSAPRSRSTSSRSLSRFTERVIACFDGDAAGRRAAARSFPAFVDAGLWGRGVFLPAGDDPDTFVRAHGAAAFAALLDDGAEPLIEAWLARGSSAPTATPSAVARRPPARSPGLLQRLRSRDPDKFDVLAGRAAQTIGVRRGALACRGRRRRRPAPAAPAPRSAARASGGGAHRRAAWPSHPAVARACAAGRASSPSSSDPGWRAPRRSASLAEPGGDPDAPRRSRCRASCAIASSRRLLDESDEEERERALADYIAKIQARRLASSRGRLLDELRAAEARGDVAGRRAALKTQLHEYLTEKTRT